jgi:hypothetical protein
MAKALLLLSVVLMLVTAGLGFATKGKISAMQGNLSEARQKELLPRRQRVRQSGSEAR